jgi:methyl-CpG-binding domain protein 4
MKRGWIPSRSPYSLIQEDVWSPTNGGWLVLVSCVLLNCTTRKQVQKVMPRFHHDWNSPAKFLLADVDDVQNTIKCLGFGSRRTLRLRDLAQDMLAGFTDPRELRGIGEYSARSYEIFCLGKLGDEEPSDGSLGRYWRWAKRNLSR